MLTITNIKVKEDRPKEYPKQKKLKIKEFKIQYQSDDILIFDLIFNDSVHHFEYSGVSFPSKKKTYTFIYSQ